MAGLQRWQRDACAQVRSYIHPSNPRSSKPCLNPSSAHVIILILMVCMHCLLCAFGKHACWIMSSLAFVGTSQIVQCWQRLYRGRRKVTGAVVRLTRSPWGFYNLKTSNCQIEISPCQYVNPTITFSYRGRKAQWQISQAYLLMEIFCVFLQTSHGHFERVFLSKIQSLDFYYNIMNCVNAL
jgi:hypothetical protein